MMDPLLQDLAWTNSINIPINGAVISNTPIQEWTPDEVSIWLATVDGGRFSSLVLPPNMDGQGLLELDADSLNALSAGNLRAARQGGEGEA